MSGAREETVDFVPITDVMDIAVNDPARFGALIDSRLVRDPSCVSLIPKVADLVRFEVKAISSDAMEAEYVGKLNEVVEVSKVISETRKKYGEPFRMVVSAVNAFFSPFSGPMEKKADEFKAALKKWALKKREVADAEARKVELRVVEAQAQGVPVGKLIGPRKTASSEPLPKKSFRIVSTWRIKVQDLKSLVSAVNCGSLPIECLSANESVLKNLAKGGMKETLSKSGVLAWEE